MNVIEVEGLKKRFGDVRAVDGVSFCVREGGLFAFLGLNGAGKSTTINILCSILKKDAGKVRIAGLDLDRDALKIKRQIGIIFQNSVLDNLLSVRDNLITRAAYYGLQGKACRARIEELSQLLDLGELLGRPYGKLSGGQRRRVDIARALLMRPRLLFLDEPTTGLDPQTRRSVWSIIRRIQAERGMTVFLTTHYMEEADTADDVVIMDAGRIAARGTPHELKTNFSGNYILSYGSHNEELLQVLQRDCVGAVRRGDAVVIRISTSAEAKDVLTRYADFFTDFEVKKGDMDDVFLNVTGKVLEGK